MGRVSFADVNELDGLARRLRTALLGSLNGERIGTKLDGVICQYLEQKTDLLTYGADRLTDDLERTWRFQPFGDERKRNADNLTEKLVKHLGKQTGLRLALLLLNLSVPLHDGLIESLLEDDFSDNASEAELSDEGLDETDDENTEGETKTAADLQNKGSLAASLSRFSSGDEVLNLDRLRSSFEEAEKMKIKPLDSPVGVLREALRSFSSSMGASDDEWRSVYASTSHQRAKGFEKSVLRHLDQQARSVAQLRLRIVTLNSPWFKKVALNYLDIIQTKALDIEHRIRDENLQYLHAKLIFTPLLSRLRVVECAVDETLRDENRSPEDILFDFSTKGDLARQTASVEVNNYLLFWCLRPQLRYLEDVTSVGVSESTPSPPAFLSKAYETAEMCAASIRNFRQLFGTQLDMRDMYTKVLETETEVKLVDKLEEIFVGSGDCEVLTRGDGQPSELPSALLAKVTLEKLLRERFFTADRMLVSFLKDEMIIIEQLARLRDAAFNKAISQFDHLFETPKTVQKILMNDLFQEALEDQRRPKAPVHGWLGVSLEVVDANEVESAGNIRLWSLRLAVPELGGLDLIVNPEMIASLSKVTALILEVQRALQAIENVQMRTAKGKTLKLELAHIARCLQSYLYGSVAFHGWDSNTVSRLQNCESLEVMKTIVRNWITGISESCFGTGRGTVANALHRILRASQMIGIQGDAAVESLEQEIQHCIRFLLGALNKLSMTKSLYANLYKELYCRLDFSYYYSSRIQELTGVPG